MTTLFNLEEYRSAPLPQVDSYWDELVLDCSGSVESSGQTTLFYDDSQEPPDPDDYSSIENYQVAFRKWRTACSSASLSHNPDVNIVEMSVLEDDKPILSALPEQRKNQWIEKYSVKRSNRKHWYFRYCYYQSGKIYHIHIPGGNASNAIAISRKKMIERAIAASTSPMEIRNFISGGFGLNGCKLST
jgi:hypothetical protein